MASIQEHVTFLIDEKDMTWWNRPYFMLMKMIPLAPSLELEEKEQIKHEILQQLDRGRIVALTVAQKDFLEFSDDPSVLSCPLYVVSFPETLESSNGLKKCIPISLYKAI